VGGELPWCGPGCGLWMRRPAGRNSDAGGVASVLRDLRRFGRMSRSGEMRRREFVAGTGARNERRSRTQSLDKPSWAVGGVAGGTPAEGVAAHEVAARGRLPPPGRRDRRNFETTCRLKQLPRIPILHLGDGRKQPGFGTLDSEVFEFRYCPSHLSPEH